MNEGALRSGVSLSGLGDRGYPVGSAGDDGGGLLPTIRAAPWGVGYEIRRPSPDAIPPRGVRAGKAPILEQNPAPSVVLVEDNLPTGAYQPVFKGFGGRSPGIRLDDKMGICSTWVLPVLAAA